MPDNDIVPVCVHENDADIGPEGIVLPVICTQSQNSVPSVTPRCRTMFGFEGGTVPGVAGKDNPLSSTRPVTPVTCRMGSPSFSTRYRNPWQGVLSLCSRHTLQPSVRLTGNGRSEVPGKPLMDNLEHLDRDPDSRAVRSGGMYRQGQALTTFHRASGLPLSSSRMMAMFLRSPAGPGGAASLVPAIEFGGTGHAPDQPDRAELRQAV